MEQYVNLQTGRIIEWNPENGILITNIWQKVEEPERDDQIFRTVKELEQEADKSYEAKTKAGGTYDFIENEWVRRK